MSTQTIDEPMTTEPTGGCPERAAACWCTKDAGHVEAGDPDHECEPHCGGAWQGHWGDGARVIRFPSGRPGGSGLGWSGND